MNKGAFRPLSKSVIAADIMTPRVEFVYFQDTIDHVANLFSRQRISAAPVIGRSGLPVGVITKSDITRYESRRIQLRPFVGDGKTDTISIADVHPGFCLDAGAERVESWMTPRIESVSPGAPLTDVVKIMTKQKLHHVFVRNNRTGKITGVISTYDLAMYLKLRAGSLGRGGD